MSEAAPLTQRLVLRLALVPNIPSKSWLKNMLALVPSVMERDDTWKLTSLSEHKIAEFVSATNSDHN